jgi:serine/threonine protein kinase/tetratricopeptide (TPR) repeat protein
MGVVYRAYDPELDRPVALKLLRAASDGWGGAQRDRLMREAQALARLQHPNVIAVYDVGTFRGDVFIAMELVEGSSMHQWLKEPGRTRKEILAVFLAAGEGLAAAHRAELVHRDFKPDNVMIGSDGRVRVLDFGLARMAHGASDRPPSIRTAPPAGVEEPTIDDRPQWPSNDRTLTAPADVDGEASRMPGRPGGSETPPPSASGSGRSGPNLLATPLTLADSIVGTPRFMSPEQTIGVGIDRRADEFSFCVALYQALYGAYPFAGTPYDEVRDWRVQEPPEATRVPRWLRQVLLKGLAERPDDRYASMPELLDALRADPWVARRRWWRVGGGVALVACAGLAWGAVRRDHARICGGAERALAGVWDDARRAQIAAAFRRSGLPYADAALATVDKSFDDYARSWLAMHVDACEATRVRGEQSQELLDLRMMCLTDRFTELRTLSDLFSAADAKVVEHAAQSAQSLPSLTSCADTAALKAPTPPPRDPKTLEQVSAVREELARAEALEVATRFDEGLDLGRAALSQAEALAYAPVVAEAELRVGRLLGDRGDFAGSAHALHRAYVSALAGRDDDAAARSATQMIIAIGSRQAHYEEGERWADVAEALASRMQRKDELLGILYSQRSSLREREGKYDDALEDAKRALEIERRVFGPDDFRVAQTYYELGAIHYFRAEHAEALEAYRKCLEIQSRTVGPDHPVLLGAKVGIADVYGDSGDHARALAEYESVLATMRRVRPEDPDIPMIQNNLGGELQQLDRPEEAFQQYQLAFEDWRKRIGPGKETITALSNMGEAKLAMGAPEEALRYYDQGLEMCGVSLGREHPDCARLLWGVGESYRVLGKTNEALSSYERSLALAEKALGPKHPQLTGPLLGLARIDLARQAPGKAKEALERVLAILGDEPGEGLTLPDARFLLAQADWSLGDRAGALDLAAKAREGYEAAGAPGRRALALLAPWSEAHRRE